MNYFNIILLDSEFDDLKAIGDKIIPSDIWSFVIQLTATAILVFVLAKFLVKPAKKFIQARQDFIQSNIDEAEKKNSEASKYLEESKEELAKARTTSKEMVSTAHISAINDKNKIIEETKLETAQMKDKALKDIEAERVRMKEKLQEEVVDVAILAASKIVDRELNDEDNKKIVTSFIEDNK